MATKKAALSTSHMTTAVPAIKIDSNPVPGSYNRRDAFEEAVWQHVEPRRIKGGN